MTSHGKEYVQLSLERYNELIQRESEWRVFRRAEEGTTSLCYHQIGNGHYFIHEGDEVNKQLVKDLAKDS